MLLAPHGNKVGGLRGWGPFFSDYGFSAQDFAYWQIGRVMIDMLILQTVFLAVLFAVIANIHWRPSRRLLIWFGVCVMLLLIVGFGFPAFQQRMKAGAEREEALASFNIQNEDFDKAKEHFLKVSNYWWWKGWWNGARDAKQRAFDDHAMQRQAAAFHAEKDEQRARQLLRVANVFDQFDSGRSRQSNAFADLIPNAKRYPDDDSVTEAKRLLLDAAEQWHIAGSAAQEQRVREWQKNVKTKAELLASLPDRLGFIPDEPKNDQRWRGDPIIAPAAPAWAQEQVPDSAKKDQFKSANEYLKSTNQEDEKLVHDPIDYQLGQWTTNRGKAFAVAKFFERNLGDRKGDLDALADRIGAQKRYMLIEKQQRGGVWWVRVFLYKQ